MPRPVTVLTARDRARTAWRISSFSNSAGGSCVEVGPLSDPSGRVAVRHSHHPGCTAFVVGMAQ